MATFKKSLSHHADILCKFGFQYFTNELYTNFVYTKQALLYADPFDVEAQKKIEAAIRQVHGHITFFFCFIS